MASKKKKKKAWKKWTLKSMAAGVRGSWEFEEDEKKTWVRTWKSWMENLEGASTGGMSKGGGWLEYLLPSAGGV